MIPPRIVQSPLLLGAAGYYHAFLGIDPVPARRHEERLRTVFSVPPSRIGLLRQVHSASALELADGDLADGGARRREGDALWTARPGTGAGVHTADCVPILVARRGGPACAAVHAGWRGLAAGVVENTVRRLVDRPGTAAPGDLVAAAGPSARGCCYEVGEEVADRLRPLPGGARRLLKGKGPGKWNADLQALAVDALVAAGLSPGRVEAVGPCTICSPSFHSYRREKSLTARQLSFIYILWMQEP
ncbi:MAG: polyphenol oxidase family protein [Deltaproteobacteria bacterium]